MATSDKQKLVSETKFVSPCPEDGQCSWTLMANTTLVLREDSIGALFPKFEAATDVHVLKFAFVKDTDPNRGDAAYKEEILIEIPNDMTRLSLQDEALQQAKVTYRRQCFCRGESGYFSVKKGQLSVSKNDHNYSVFLRFANENVPQILTAISGTLLEPL